MLRERHLRGVAVFVLVLLLGAVPAIPAGAAPGDVATFPTVADINRPNGLTVDADGNVWFTNDGGTSVPVGPFGGGLALDGEGDLWFGLRGGIGRLER